MTHKLCDRFTPISSLKKPGLSLLLISLFKDLRKENISYEEYKFGQDLWKIFKLKNLGESHDLYMETDVLLLADIFETLRDVSLYNYKLDPTHFCTAPWLSWAACLKYTTI